MSTAVIRQLIERHGNRAVYARPHGCCEDGILVNLSDVHRVARPSFDTLFGAVGEVIVATLPEELRDPPELLLRELESPRQPGEVQLLVAYDGDGTAVGYLNFVVYASPSGEVYATVDSSGVMPSFRSTGFRRLGTAFSDAFAMICDDYAQARKVAAAAFFIELSWPDPAASEPQRGLGPARIVHRDFGAAVPVIRRARGLPRVMPYWLPSAIGGEPIPQAPFYCPVADGQRRDVAAACVPIFDRQGRLRVRWQSLPRSGAGQLERLLSWVMRCYAALPDFYDPQQTAWIAARISEALRTADEVGFVLFEDAVRLSETEGASNAGESA